MIRVRMAVAREELLDAQRSGAVDRPDERRHRRARARSTPRGGMMNARMMISLSSLSVCTSDKQVFAIELDHFARPHRRAIGRATRRPESMLASPVNCSGAMNRDAASRLSRMAGRSSSRPCRDDEERHDMFPRLEEHLSSSDRTHVAMHSDPLNLSRRQRWKYPLHTGGKCQREWKSCISHGKAPFLTRSCLSISARAASAR